MGWPLPKRDDCAACVGTGRNRYLASQPCPHCHGRGTIMTEEAILMCIILWGAIAAVVFGGFLWLGWWL